MGDSIRALSDVADKHGLGFLTAIVAIMLLIALMFVHLQMLRKWNDSTERLARSSEERVANVEKRSDQLLVSNLNLTKSLIDVNSSQDKKLDQLVQTTKDAADQAEQSATQSAIQVKILADMREGQLADRKLLEVDRDWWRQVGSDPKKLCQVGMMAEDVKQVARDAAESLKKLAAIEKRELLVTAEEARLVVQAEAQKKME